MWSNPIDSTRYSPQTIRRPPWRRAWLTTEVLKGQIPVLAISLLYRWTASPESVHAMIARSARTSQKTGCRSPARHSRRVTSHHLAKGFIPPRGAGSLSGRKARS